jgi:hypothetical protein
MFRSESKKWIGLPDPIPTRAGQTVIKYLTPDVGRWHTSSWSEEVPVLIQALAESLSLLLQVFQNPLDLDNIRIKSGEVRLQGSHVIPDFTGLPFRWSPVCS